MAKQTNRGSRPQTDGFKQGGEYRSGPLAGTMQVPGNTFTLKGLAYAEVDGFAMFEGDIILGTIGEADEGGISVASIGITGPQFRWPDATIPYVIDPGMPNQQRITDAIAHWQASTRIRFVLRTAANASQFPDFLRFQSGNGCSSMVGKRGGQQILTLGNGCSTGNAIHEIGHAVGLWHEQSREDRDSFVRIVWANIDPSMQHNFTQHISDGDDLGPYDYGSIMHYPATAFSTNGQPTIIPLQPLPPGVVMGQRNGLSQGDINGVHLLYPRGTVTIKEVAKDPIQDPVVTVKEVNKDPIRDHVTVKELTKDPIRDPIGTIKEVPRDPVGTWVETIRQPGFGGMPPLGGGPSPFVLATGNRAFGAGGGQMEMVQELNAQAGELALAIQSVEQQYAQLVAAYDAVQRDLASTQQNGF